VEKDEHDLITRFENEGYSSYKTTLTQNIMKDDMNFTPFEEGNNVQIIANTIYLVSGDIGEKIAYSYCIL